MDAGASLHRHANELAVAVLFYTRLPVPHRGEIAAGDLAQASWAAPVAGALVGALGAAAYALAHGLGLPPSVAAGLAVATTLIATGGLHEDGLADTADGFGAGATRERRLEIMRDAWIGAFGACALVLSLALRWSALATLADPLRVAATLIAAHAAARAMLPVLMAFTPPARTDGLSATAGAPPADSVAAAALLGVVVLALGLGLKGGFVALLVLIAGAAAMRWLTMRKIGGQTGDVLGATEQLGEILVMLTAAAIG